MRIALMSLPLPIQGYLLGWAVAAPIGPVNIEIVRRGLRRGLAAGFGVGCGATLVDFAYMMLVSFGLASFLRHRWVLIACFVVGAGLMAFLAVMALRDAWRCTRGADLLKEEEAAGASIPAPGRRAQFGRGLLVGLGMTASNPMTIAFWATLPSLFFPGRIPDTVSILTASLAVWCGAFSWVSTLTLLMAIGRHIIGPRLFAIVSGLGGVAMAWFALRFGWLALHTDSVLARMGS